MIPKWIQLRMVQPGGVRLAKRPELLNSEGNCPECGKPVLLEKLHSEWQLKGTRSGADVYHYTCWYQRKNGTNHYEEQHRHLYHAGGAARLPLKGNLDNEEYRYWVGNEHEASSLAICRCCRTSVYNAPARALHFKDVTFSVNGDPCSVRLVRAYKLLLQRNDCVVCGKERYGKDKWGVPLCSEACIEKWKFDDTRWVTLYRKLFAQVKEHPALSEGIVAVGPGMIPKTWCVTCSMFMDEEGHDLMHMQWGGNFANKALDA